MASDITAQIVALKTQVASAQKLRAEAEAGLGVAKQRLAEVDAKLKGLGLNPENAEVEVAALEEQLQKAITDYAKAVNAEIAAYNEVNTAVKAAFAA